MNTIFALSTEIEAPQCATSQFEGSFPLTFSHSPDLQIETMCAGNVIIIGDTFHADARLEKPAEETRGSPLNILKQIAAQRWGRFVGVAFDPQTAQLAIYRDPSGMVPCYYGHSSRKISIGTDAHTIVGDLSLTPRMDLVGIANCLLAPDRRRRGTGLHGIAEVLPGELVVIGKNQACHELLWRPDDHVGRLLDIKFEQAAERLEYTLSQIMDRWCQRYPHPLISVSGGFDSSAIAALAAQRGPTNLFQLYADSPLADERRYGGVVAKHIGLDLQTFFCDPCKADIGVNLSSSRPRPSARLFTQIFDQGANQRALRVQAGAHFNGGGGDNVFGKLHSAYPLTDRYLFSGFSTRLFGIANDICGATGASLPTVLRQAIAGAHGRDRAKGWPDTTDLLSHKAIAMRDNELHPWVKAVERHYPGQRQHVRNVSRATASTDHLNISSQIPTIYPLLSQPIVELCLSFPTWYWFNGGHDRALARAAMKRHLPNDILNRRLKGAFDGLVYQIIDLHRARILADLQSGVLASEGLIDVEAVQQVLTLRGGGETRAIRVLHLHEVEMWCRHWC